MSTTAGKTRQSLQLIDIVAFLAFIVIVCAAGCSLPKSHSSTQQERSQVAAVSMAAEGAFVQPHTDQVGKAVAAGGGMNRAISKAIRATDGYWVLHWADNFMGSYRSPAVYGSYSDVTAPSCGGRKAPPMNAIYCFDGDYIAWDALLMAQEYGHGEVNVYLIIAHEWAHAIQARLDPVASASALELQADCLAGAVLDELAEGGDILLGPGVDNLIVEGLARSGDTSPWDDPSDHGTGLERAHAFFVGRTGGVSACIPYPMTTVT